MDRKETLRSKLGNILYAISLNCLVVGIALILGYFLEG